MAATLDISQRWRRPAGPIFRANALSLAPTACEQEPPGPGDHAADQQRVYREVFNLANMISGVTNLEEMAGLLTQFFDEAERYARDEEQELVLFMDEFHQIIQLSPAAVEALKPILAASGTRGLRIIAATTYDEFEDSHRAQPATGGAPATHQPHADGQGNHDQDPARHGRAVRSC